MKLHIIINPNAGNGKAKRAAPKLFAMLDAFHIQYETAYSRGPGDATLLAQELDHRASVLIAMGGDGTVNEIVNGIMDSEITLGVIPIGTGNDFAKMLGAGSLETAAALLQKAHTTAFDVARIECVNQDGSAIGRYFINTMGVGFDALVAAKVAKMKHLGGALPYLVTALRTLGSYKSVPSILQMNGQRTEETMFLATIGNGTTSGGGFILSPRAVPTDGLLDLCFVSDLKKSRVLRVIPKTFSGGHLGEPEVSYTQSDHFELELARPLPVHVDGEIITEQALRIKVSLSEKRLPVITDATFG
jgi:diacylglycerol kinase (ATP)